MAIHGLTTHLWFDQQALEAAEFYVALFPDSHMKSVSYYREGAPMPAGTVLVVEFDLMGQPFAALNGGPEFPHSEAVSFQVKCDAQDEIDRLWDALISDGGEESMCGWCKDKFGVSWQVVPTRLQELLEGDDQQAADVAWAALMEMRKLDIAGLEGRSSE